MQRVNSYSYCEGLIRESEEDGALSILSCGSAKEKAEKFIRSINISRDVDPRNDTQT